MYDSSPNLFRRAARALRYTITGAGPETWMGPLQPLAPMAPEGVRGRQFDFPVGYNLSYIPRTYEGVGFAQLRRLADGCDLLRIVIERQKDLLEALDWSVKPREVKPGARPAEGTYGSDLRQLRQFLSYPDRVHDWAQWLRLVLEDLFVIDAVSLYRRRTRGGGLYALEPLDGATIKVLLDGSGRPAQPAGPGLSAGAEGHSGGRLHVGRAALLPEEPTQQPRLWLLAGAADRGAGRDGDRAAEVAARLFHPRQCQ